MSEPGFPWSLLDIEPTTDERAIKSAYVRRLRQTNPEDDPEGFQELRSAYELALKIAETDFVPSPVPMPYGDEIVDHAEPVDPPFERVADVWPVSEADPAPAAIAQRLLTDVENVMSRLLEQCDEGSVADWQAIFGDDALWNLDVRMLFEDRLFWLVLEGGWIPASFWQASEAEFHWIADSTPLYARHPRHAVEHVLARAVKVRGMQKPPRIATSHAPPAEEPSKGGGSGWALFAIAVVVINIIRAIAGMSDPAPTQLPTELNRIETLERMSPEDLETELRRIQWGKSSSSISAAHMHKRELRRRFLELNGQVDLERRAKSGDAEAQWQLAQLHWTTHEVMAPGDLRLQEQDAAKTRHWAAKAAAQGVEDAQAWIREHPPFEPRPRSPR